MSFFIISEIQSSSKNMFFTIYLRLLYVRAGQSMNIIIKTTREPREISSNSSIRQKANYDVITIQKIFRDSAIFKKYEIHSQTYPGSFSSGLLPVTLCEDNQSWAGTRQQFSFATTTTRQCKRPSATRKNTKNVKASVSKQNSHKKQRQFLATLLRQCCRLTSSGCHIRAYLGCLCQ